MPNLSQIKRQRMLDFLETLKKEHTDDESIRAFAEIENQLRDKKYGLVFEEHAEQVDELLSENIPVLCEDDERRICKDSNLPWNFIIEGDNLQALYLLEKTHKGKVDCIYIDPPYNTGAKDWKYNNDYVDGNDTYRHSKWLSMMKARLEIAKRLLSPNGAIICAIDENEMNTLGLLLHEMFSEYIISCVVVVHNPGGIQGGNFSYCHEYAYFVFPNKNGYIKKEHRNIIGELTPFRDWGKENSKRQGAPNCFYPIVVDTLSNRVVRAGTVPPNDFHPKSANELNGTELTVWPIDANGIERRWRFAYNTVEDILDELIPITIKGVVNIQRNKQLYTRKTVWENPAFFANNSGSQLIANMIGNRFSFPKSLYLVLECLRACDHGKDSVIVDFFAGSGTTLHAVNLLNSEDGGHRRCIMVTNNEVSLAEAKRLTKQGYKKGDPEWEALGIAKYVTWPRTVCSIEGRDINGHALKGNYGVEIETYEADDEVQLLSKTTGKPIKKTVYRKVKHQQYPQLAKIKKSDGFVTNVKYFKCDWTPRKPEDYLLSNALCLHIREMIELQNGIEVDNVKNVLILNKDDYQKYVMNDRVYSQIENIWVNQNIVFNAEEMARLNALNFKYIPKEFFGQELKGAAE